MSDTPRTDDQECDMFVGVSTFTPSDIQQAFDFARQLERELNAANESFRKLNIHALDLAARIKRLEEAGDALYENSDPTRWDSLQAANRKLDDQEAWRKAKEAKP